MKINPHLEIRLATPDERQQLTVFFNGRIAVSCITGDQARAIILLASQVMDEKSNSSPGSDPYSPMLNSPLHSPITSPSMMKSLQRFLLTIPPSVGYAQNPLSIYYCDDIEDSNRTLRKYIAKVSNTPWGERITFLFNPNSDLVAKPLHVSPFMDMHGNWSMKTSEPTDKLHVVISVEHPKLGNYLTASLTAKKVDSSTSGDDSGFFWLMPHKVALWIYWHALKLWWKNVAFIQHPRYTNPSSHREDARVRDESIPRCMPRGKNIADNIHSEEKAFESAAKLSSKRSFSWRDAPWPWC